MTKARWWRIYYDRRDESGKVWWSIDNGDTSSEIKVCQILIDHGVRAATEVGLSSAPKGEPSGWMSVYARAEFEGGLATFKPEYSVRVMQAVQQPDGTYIEVPINP